MRRRIHALVIAALFASLLSGITVLATAPANAVAACDTGVTAQNGVTVAPQHGKIFYVDSGQGQNVDAAYVSYKITAGSTLTNIWAKLDTFTGGTVSLANIGDANLPLGNITTGSSQTAFFLLKAAGSSLTSQAHTMHVYKGQPGLSGSTELYSCIFTFTKVSETIKAAANKVTTITPSVSTYVLGGTMTVVVEGATGTIGAGPSSDPNMMWISPVSKSSWPTSALRLTATAVEFWTNANRNSGFHVGTAAPGYVNQLQIGSLSSLGSKLFYTATYTFKIIGKSSAAATVAPIAQITSGTQVKHTDMSSLPSATVSSNTVTINSTMTKTASTTTSRPGSNKTQFSYTITLTNGASAGSASVVFDSVVDTPASGLTYVASSVRLAGAATAEPSLDSSNKLVFSQPITVAANSSVALTYTMEESVACVTSAGFTYANSAIAKIGTITIGASASTYSNVSSAGTCGTATTVVTVTTPTLPVELVTLPASPVANTTATLNGTVDPNGTSGLSVVFEYGTSPTLSTFTSVTLGTLSTGSTSSYGVSTALNSLSTGTTYYFRVRIGTVYGDILSFTTTEPVATPTVTTDVASSVSTTAATLNSTVDPNQTAVYVEFEISSSPTLATGVSIVRLIDDPTTAWVSSTNVDSQFASASAIYPQLTISSGSTFGHLMSGSAVTSFLTTGSTVYYRARAVAVTGGTVTTASTIRSFTFTAHTDQTITFATISDISFGASAPTISPTASSGLTVSVTSSTTSVCTVSGFTITILTAGTCTLAADQAGNTTYNPADQVLQSFTVNPNTVTFNTNGGTGTTASQSATTSTALTSNGFTRSGYTFANWATVSDGTGTTYADGANYAFSSSITLYAQWNTTVTFNGNTATSGSTASQTAKTSTALTANGFSKTGYTFAGWSTTSGSAAVAYANSASYPFTGGAATLYAQWTVNTYSVTYGGNGSNGGTVPAGSAYEYGSTFTVSLNSGSLTKSSFTFSRWNTADNGTGTFYTASGSDTFTVTSAVVLYAQWAGSRRTVTFNANGGTGTTAAQEATESSPLTTNGFSKTNYTFSRWSTNADGTGTSYANGGGYGFTDDLSLYAQWASTVTFDINTGTSGSTAAQTADTATVLTANGFSKTNYTFAGWSTTSGSASVAYANSASYPFTAGATTLYAQWTLNGVSFTYNGNSSTGGTVPSSSSPGIGTTATVSTNSGSLVRDGYVFSRWNTASNGSGTYNATGDTLTVTSAITFFAQWNATVTFNANSGTGSDYTQTADKATALSANTFSRTNYTFGGWSTASGVRTVEYANSASYPFNSGATTLYAQWTGTTFTTTYNYNEANGDTATVTSDYITGGTAITLPTPTKTGYTFAGWNSDSGLTTSIGAGGDSYSPTSSATVYAAWNSTVTFNANGGSGSDYTQVARVATNLTTNTFTRTSFTFASWNTVFGGGGTTHANSASYPFSAGATMLYAQWTAAATFTVSYNGNSNTGGTAPSASTFTVGGSALTLPGVGSLVKSGSTFGGWSTSTSGTAVSSPYTPASSLTLYAVWTVDVYTITYNGNGNTDGSAPASSIFTVGSTAITLPSVGTLVRSRFIFAGWSTSTSGAAVSSRYSPNSSLTLYAVWAAEPGVPAPVPTPTPSPTPSPTPIPTPRPTATPTPSPTPSPTPRPTATPTPSPTPTPGASIVPVVVKEVIPGVSAATENGVNVPTTVKLIPSLVATEKPKSVEIAGDGWKIQITGSKDVVQGTPTDPSSIVIVLIQGVDATTSGFGFKAGTMARVYLFSTPIFLGEALVKADGTFKATFPVSTKITIGDHTMQVEGITTTGVQRKAAVGLLVQANLAKQIKLLDKVYYTTNFWGLTRANNDKLNAVAKTAKSLKYSKIWLYGYTDIIKGVDNIWLSRQRANTARSYLQKLLPKVSIQIKYFGPANPAVKAKTKAAFALNRRVEIYGQK